MISLSLKKMVVFILIIIGLLLSVQLGHYFGLRSAYHDLSQQSNHNLNSLVSYIENTLGRFEKVPEVLSKHPLLLDVLMSKNDNNLLALNHLLENVCIAIKATDIYLMNAQGTTVAASNWRSENTFINKNFAGRQYFAQAMSGRLGRYYAVGLISDKRGYFFAYPVMSNGVAHGVIVVKVQIDDIELLHEVSLGENNYNFLITAPDNVVFISNRDEWRLKLLGQLTPEKHQQLIDSKRYAGRPIEQLMIYPAHSYMLPDDIKAKIYRVGKGRDVEQFFGQTKTMENAEWQVHVWSSLEPIDREKSFLTVMSISCYLLVLFLILFTKERIRNVRHLQQSRALLEQRVKERTADLTTINQQLTAEIQQREQTQQQLERTQEELIQSAKLAVIGNMSASINHEINQPLTALRSYGQNALAYLDREMADKAKSNLQLMIGLVDRLSTIVSQFKNFTKKSSGSQTRLLVQDSIVAAIAIVKHQLEHKTVHLDYQQGSEPLYTLGDGVRLEQVIVNLLSNAIQAMAGQERKELSVKLQSSGDQVKIVISDTGPGILEGNLDRIFEPFFTTKESFGLGLGLSISHRIIESMQGQLSVTNRPEGGAAFTVSLPKFNVNKD